MHEHGMGYMNHPAVAGRIGDAMARAAVGDGRDDVAQRERQERNRERRARMARVLRALAARLAPPVRAPGAASTA